MKLTCISCGRVIKFEYLRYLKNYGIIQRVNYAFGKKQKGNTTFTCDCGGIAI